METFFGKDFVNDPFVLFSSLAILHPDHWIISCSLYFAVWLPICDLKQKESKQV